MTADPDLRFLAAAIRLGSRWRGATAENPAVGALVVREIGGVSVVVGRGATARGGRPHAEAIALAEAGEEAKGATCYVSLEPCAHHGRTPPCAGLLRDAGVARVVSAIEDPDPRVAGQGHRMLGEAGIQVRTGLLRTEAERANRGFLTRVREGRAAVTLKMAVSRDGMIAGQGGRPVAITGPEALASAHMLRATHDAILVGIGTILADDPRLTCRLPGMEDRSPLRVVLDGSLRTPSSARILRDADVAPVHIFAGEAAPLDGETALVARGATVHRLPAGPDGRPEIADVLARLAALGIGQVLVEGGAEIYRSLLAADLADDAVIFGGAVDIGTAGVPALPAPGLAIFEQTSKYRRLSSQRRGDDLMVAYERTRLLHE